MKKILISILCMIMILSLVLCCGAAAPRADDTGASGEAPFPDSETELGSGTVATYDDGDILLHVYYTNDALGDVVYILEGEVALLGIELPAFTADLDAWQEYIESLGKPMDDIFLDAHPTGASYIEGMTVYGTQGAADAISSGSTYATTEGLYDTFGEDFHGGDDMAEIDRVVSGTVTIAGIDLEIIDRGDTYDIVIPALDAVYTHKLGKTTHSILPTTGAMEEMTETLLGYQAQGYDMILSAHSGVEGQDAVTEKLAYLEITAGLAESCTSAEAFTQDMLDAFPGYDGEDYLEMTAGYLFPAADWAYAEIALDSEDYGVSSIYYVSSCFTTDTVDPVTTEPYTEERVAEILAGAEEGAEGYVTDVPAGASLGVGIYGTEDILWYDSEGAAAIVSHADPLYLNAATGEMSTADGDIVATAIA